MALIVNTSSTTSFQYPSGTVIDRAQSSGNLYVMVKSSTADTYSLYRSTDGGASWAILTSFVRTGLVEFGSIVIPRSPYDATLFFCYRVNESSTDKVYVRTINDLGATSPTWNSEVLVTAAANGGVAGAVYQGLDLQVWVIPGVLIYVPVAVGTTSGATVGTTLFVCSGGRPDTLSVFNYLISGTRQWFYTDSGRITPSLELEHTGDGKNSSNPSLWLAFGRTQVYFVRLTWTGNGWQGPSSAIKVNAATIGTAVDFQAGRYDGTRFMAVMQDPTSTSRVLLIERNKANSTTTIRQTTTAHTTGVIRACTLAYNSVTGDPRVFAIGTSTAVLYYNEYSRTGGTWGGWTSVSSALPLGTPPNNWQVRRNNAGSAQYDNIVLVSGGNHSNVIVGTNYAPNAPDWDITAMGRPSQGGVDVAAALLLDWTFTDPNPADTQGSYAIQRQIFGSPTITYYRASDNTWQPTEVQNASATSAVTIPAAWASAGDPYWLFHAKVWDAAGLPSVYGDLYAVAPDAKSNPTITAPGATINSSRVTATWTVAAQSAFRVRLLTNPGGVVGHDSGFVPSSSLSYTVPRDLADLSGWTVEVTTKSLRGLSSNAVTTNFTVDIIEPAVATTTAVPTTATGVVAVTIVNPAPVGSQPTVTDQDVYRRLVGGTTYAVMNANPFFETNTTDWTSPGGLGTLTQSGVQFHQGAGAARLVPVSGAVVTIESSLYAITPGIPYSSECWMRFDTGNKPGVVYLHWFDVSNVFISSSSMVIQAVAGGWVYNIVADNPPPLAVKVKIAAGLTGTPAAGDAVYIDEAKLRPYNTDQGVRVAAGISSGGTASDYFAVHGVEYEYRALTRGNNNSTVYTPWTP